MSRKPAMRPLPHTPANEAAVCGSMIVDPRCIDGVTKQLTREAFFCSEHKILFDAIISLYEKNQGEALDGLLVRNELEQRNQLDAIGGTEYLQRVIEAVPSSASVQYYIDRVREDAGRRGFIEIGNRIVEGGYDQTVSLPERVKESHEDLEGLGELPSREGKRCTYRPRVLDLNLLTPRETDWIIPGYMPCGALTIVAGNPGAGKTTFALDVMTRLSRGRPQVVGGEQSAKQGISVIAANEDSVERVLLGKLTDMGADLTQIKVLADVEVREGGAAALEPFTIEMLEALDQLITTYPTIRLLFLDNLPDCMGACVKDNDNRPVRKVLRPLGTWADKHNVAILANSHLNKRSDCGGILRILGSMGYAAMARAVLGVSIHPEDADKPAWDKRRVVSPIKQSYAPEGDALVFRIDQGLRTLIWDSEPLPMGADEALSGAAPRKNTTRAESWLRTQLDDACGPVDSKLLKARAVERNICEERTLIRAAGKIGVAKATTGVGKSFVSWWGRPGMDIDTWLQQSTKGEPEHGHS